VAREDPGPSVLLVEDDPAHPRFIQTVWGHGYVFVPGGG